MAISQATIDRLLKDQHGACCNCGRDLYQGMEIHHAIYSRDTHFSKYLDQIENLVALCPKCHRNHGKLSNIEGRKKFWKMKVEHGYLMDEWHDSIPMLVKDQLS
jgi:5-methylcytosine-specific restriction endonuclease McrA